MKAIAILPYNNYGTIPALESLARELRRRGHSIALFYRAEQVKMPEPCFPWTDIKQLLHVDNVGIRSRILELRVWQSNIRQYQAKEGCDLFICVDPMGLAVGVPVAISLAKPVVYLSLEMLFWRELRTLSLLGLKALETVYIRRVSLILVQDCGRANALRKSCKLRKINWREFPNAWPGSVIVEKSPRLRQTLDIEDGKRIAIHAGSVCDWTMVAELAEAATTWTKEWVFVIQSRIPIGSSAYEQRLLKLVDGDKVRILPAALSQSALLEILSGADVGLAFYAVRERHPTLGRNLELAGKSSGKFSSYLHAGLPVICNQRGGLATYVEKWGCGKVVSSVDDIKMAMTPITQELEKFSDAARRCFSAEFATDRYLPNICNDIGKMVKT